MSTYYSFYIGYKTKDGKYHAYGPFDKFIKLCPVLTKSRSFISNLHHEFAKIEVDEMDYYLESQFTDSVDNKEKYSILYYLTFDKLPDGDYLKRGYYDINEVTECLKYDEFDFSDYYTIEEYAARLSQAISSNNSEEVERLKKYVYFSYPDTHCEEYDSAIIRHAVSYTGLFTEYDIEENVKSNGEDFDSIVVLMSVE